MPLLEAVAPVLLIVAVFLLLSETAGPRKPWARWAVLIVATVVVARYLPWRFTETVATRSILTVNGAWIWFLFAIECIYIADLLKILLVRTRIVDRSAEADEAEARLKARPRADWPKVDVLIPTYNEPLDVLERSIIGALNLDYPNFEVWVLDDGDRDWLRDFCAENGARYLRRPEHKHAKAGNINNALAQTDGDFVAVLDADFVPYRWFLNRTVGLFDDQSIGIVQTPQHFFNRDPVQRNLWIADRWPDEQRLFFDHLAPSLDAWDSMFCCGSCAVMRRAALDAIGGVPTQSITEDILTTLEMFRAGYRTRYLNERLTIGLAAESLEAFYVQRQRWCQGGIQTLFLRAGPLFGTGISLIQRILLFPIYWVFHIPARLIVLLVPIMYFWFGLEPLDNARGFEILYWQLPILFTGWAATLFYFGRNGLPILNDGPAILVSLRLAPVVLSSLVRPFGRPFQVTPKGSLTTEDAAVSTVEAVIITTLILLSLGGLWINIPSDTRIIENDSFLLIGGFWTGLNVVTLSLALLLCFENPVRRLQERFPIRLEARLSGKQGEAVEIRVEDLSLSGASGRVGDGRRVSVGSEWDLQLPDGPPVPGRVARVVEGEGDARIGFDFVPVLKGKRRKQMIRYLYTTGIDNAAHAGQTASLLTGLLRRLFGESSASRDRLMRKKGG
ncbi:MAG: glycosyltransferase [Nisaea sp.]|uniref:glycosyltransferase n=1 Tax=Nisaea sp. TaxID=2024842 RepID=UPI001B030A2C|nr:glycosyltransferase [Nisaea sp.]MBO6562677.1 glycosyltransferase [Nisaea sp.]